MYHKCLGSSALFYGSFLVFYSCNRDYLNYLKILKLFWFIISLTYYLLVAQYCGAGAESRGAEIKMPPGAKITN
jgi:hypothetical protein